MRPTGRTTGRGSTHARSFYAIACETASPPGVRARNTPRHASGNARAVTLIARAPSK